MEVTKLDIPPLVMGSGVPRSSGTHLTPIIRDLGTACGIMNDYSGSEWDPQLTPEVGFLWEDVFSRSYALRCKVADAIRPGEVNLDGIACSPDGMRLVERPDGSMGLSLLEYKCTWKSRRRMEEDLLGGAGGGTRWWYYLTQAKAYCKAMGASEMTFYFLFLNGDYDHKGPAFGVYRTRFLDHELDENWSMILRHRDRMLRDGSLKGSD